MKIDRNPKELEALEAFQNGDYVLARKCEDEFIAEFRQTFGKEDHCPCTRPCKFHGKCAECVAIHRAHQNHLPVCLFDIVNSKVKDLCQITEGSIFEEKKEKENAI